MARLPYRELPALGRCRRCRETVYGDPAKVVVLEHSLCAQRGVPLAIEEVPK